MAALYVLVSFVLGVILLRKFRESKWGKCKSQKMMEGKIVVVTGANSGLGKAAVTELVRRKARVIMACRDMIAAQNAVEDIRRKTSEGELILMHLDLASLKSVRSFADVLLKKFPNIDVLINNAGVYMPMEKQKKTEDGYEIHFGVNHLGPFLLTNLLLDGLQTTVSSRIIFVSSGLHKYGKIEFDNLNAEKGWDKSKRNSGYNNSKLANTFTAYELARRLKGKGVGVYAVSPGWCYTGLFRNNSFRWYQYIPLAAIMLFNMRTAHQGMQTILHCAVSEDLNKECGTYYSDCAVAESKLAQDPEIAARLWDVSKTMVGLK